MAFFLEDIQYNIFNSICKGAAFKLRNFKRDAAISALFTKRNSFIYDILNQVLEKIIPAGIPQYLVKYHESNMYKEYVPIVDNSPRVLTVDDLEYGFVLWLGACGISVVGFLLEFIWFKLRKVLRIMIGLWLFLKVLKMRLRNVVL